MLIGWCAEQIVALQTGFIVFLQVEQYISSHVWPETHKSQCTMHKHSNLQMSQAIAAGVPR